MILREFNWEIINLIQIVESDDESDNESERESDEDD